MSGSLIEKPSKPTISTRSDLREFYKAKRALVVGADGFLGVNCVYALQELGADLTVLSRREAPRAVNYQGRVVRGDLRDEDTLRRAVEGQEVVFDFAGGAGAVDSNRNPLRSVDDECRAQLGLFMAAAEASSRPVVTFCSTRLVYGKPGYLPVDEQHPVAPASFYALHKLTLEGYLSLLGNAHGLRWVVLRLSNPYGPHAEAEWRNYGLINRFINLAANGQPITIFGDGTQKRDYIHVDDVLAAFLTCAMRERCHGEVFNLGAESSIEIKKAAVEIAKLFGDTPIVHQPWPEEYRDIETGDYQTDLSKLRELAAPCDAVSFSDGLARMIEARRKWSASG